MPLPQSARSRKRRDEEHNTNFYVQHIFPFTRPANESAVSIQTVSNSSSWMERFVNKLSAPLKTIISQRFAETKTKLLERSLKVPIGIRMPCLWQMHINPDLPGRPTTSLTEVPRAHSIALMLIQSGSRVRDEIVHTHWKGIASRLG